MSEPDNRLSDREFDSWLSAADPARRESLRHPTAAGELRKHWISCSKIRRRRLVTYRRSAAAGLLVAVLTGIATTHATRSYENLSDSSKAPVDSLTPVDSVTPVDSIVPGNGREPGNSRASISPERSLSAAEEASSSRPTISHSATRARRSSVNRETAKPPASAAANRWASAVSAWSARLDEASVAADAPAMPTAASPAWRELVSEFRASTPAEHQVLVVLAPHLEKASQRAAAVALVAEAGQAAAVPVLESWLYQRSLHAPAFDQLTRLVADRHLPTLAAAAETVSERNLFCQRLVETRGVEIHLRMLLALAPNAAWRGSVQRASVDLPIEAVDGLLVQLRDGDTRQRAAAALLVSAIQREQLDQVLVDRVLSGRGRHAAYLALLARPTEEAKLFLATAARRWDLSPGLHSARHGWSHVRPIAERWSEELRGRDDAKQLENTSTKDSADPGLLALGRCLGAAAPVSGRSPT